MNQCPYCNVDIAQGYVGEVELESHLKEIHEVSFQTMHDAEKWWDSKYVPLGRPSWADMNIGQRRKTINAYLMKSPSTEMRGFLKCPKCGITFNDSENTDDDLTIHLMKDHQVPEDLAEEMTTFEVGKNGLQPTNGWASFESDPNPSKMFLDQLQNAGRDGNPNMYWNEEERQYTNDPLRDVSFDPKAGAPWQKNADLESLASEGIRDKNGNMICSKCGSSDTVVDILEKEIWEGWEKYEWWRCNYCGNSWDGDIVSTDRKEPPSYFNMDRESLASEDDPDYLNDPDYQGYTQDMFGNQVKSHPSQYTLSGWDYEEKERMNARGDVDFAFDSHSDLEELSTEKGEWDHLPHARKNIDEESKANEDSLLKVEENPEGVNVEILDQWDNNKEESDEAIDLNDISHLNPDQCIKCGEDAYWHTPEGSVSWNSHQYIPKSALASKAPEGEFGFTDPEWDGFSKDVQNQITDELTVKDLQKDSNMTDEGFVDKIDMLANKMGVNLDRDPEQVESKANEGNREDFEQWWRTLSTSERDDLKTKLEPADQTDADDIEDGYYNSRNPFYRHWYNAIRQYEPQAGIRRHYR